MTEHSGFAAILAALQARDRAENAAEAAPAEHSPVNLPANLSANLSAGALPVVDLAHGDPDHPPHRNDLLLMRDAQEAERLAGLRAMLGDAGLLAVLMLPALMMLIVFLDPAAFSPLGHRAGAPLRGLFGFGAGAAGLGFAMLFALLGSVAGFFALRRHWVIQRVRDMVWQQLAMALALTHGHGVPGGRLLVAQFRALGLVPDHGWRVSRGWLSGRLAGRLPGAPAGMDGQLFHTSLWAWPDRHHWPGRVFSGLLVRFVLNRPFRGELRLLPPGTSLAAAGGDERLQRLPDPGRLDPRLADHIMLANDPGLPDYLLPPAARPALALLLGLYPGQPLGLSFRDGLLFIAIDLEGDWYRPPGLLLAEPGVGHFMRGWRDISVLWRFAASVDARWSGI